MKLHKIYISIFCMITLSLVMSSCDGFLKEEPLDEKTAGQFWKTESDAKTAVNALYFGGVPYLNNIDVDGGWTPKATMWGGIMSGLFVDKRKDRTFTTASEGGNFNIEAFDATARKLWSEFYIGISRANFVIANIPTMTNVLSEAQINNFVAQGKFFRAYAYYYLVKEFGDVPYVDKPYTSLDGIYVERTPAVDVYKHIEEDLLSIISGDVLANKAFYANSCYVTKPMAQTLLAQVYLQWAGAPLNGGNEYYTKAANMALEVVNGGQHALIQPEGSSDDLNSAYNVIKTTKSSNEIIYAKEYNQTSYNVGNSYACRSIGTDAFQWGIFKPGGDVLYNAYLPCDMLINSYAPGDIRGHEKQFFFKEYTYKIGENTITSTLNNVGNWAWLDENALKTGKDGDYNMPTFRYAEVLLIAAEGLARTGKEGEARTYLNQVRKRAGLADETAAGDALIQSILTERFHEFPLEFKIWDDIRRTRLYPEADGNQSGKLKWVALATAKIQNKPDGSTKVGAIPEYALLWPIPLSEMQANPSLQGHQNPGWN
ncbi:MAG: RagB/SusD family nutrient uptake outer membrane protein [Dysgonomonas mossii]|uniref:RagB/SusD family nutrient uptake outer membrane protein n=1 Tax=Dysgonomonas mossii TaxID=163665 RepID=A0A4Y9IQS4_9BACT|nr:RagB/SusD family nutrient uptake outer membrane protein [Dysgonomonas mossii]MBF0759709.1 RagB/SusD family nutrient uptake outer membrane protein [Dysgonomonas mossii]MBS5797383.1 RagB/SusD family nutrient uptake outer membrane protein [Dysgonomonas mossii]MBS7110777.1 RagB/SusD family nutrient uptake outer membrane protein [Dysgonomonas mossii]TFU90672.1 RagB/SusD family nutrient uptake outer membrane protein [Dysgonomonas mossii]